MEFAFDCLCYLGWNCCLRILFREIKNAVQDLHFHRGKSRFNWILMLFSKRRNWKGTKNRHNWKIVEIVAESCVSWWDYCNFSGIQLRILVSAGDFSTVVSAVPLLFPRQLKQSFAASALSPWLCKSSSGRTLVPCLNPAIPAWFCGEFRLKAFMGEGTFCLLRFLLLEHAQQLGQGSAMVFAAWEIEKAKQRQRRQQSPDVH